MTRARVVSAKGTLQGPSPRLVFEFALPIREMPELVAAISAMPIQPGTLNCQISGLQLRVYVLSEDVRPAYNYILEFLRGSGAIEEPVPDLELTDS